MPVYEYQCTSCDDRTERVLPHREVDRPGPCPTCDGALVRRWSRIGVRLDGWGFSRNDAMIPDRPGRGDFREISERAERLADG